VSGKERDQRGLGVETEGVVVEVDRVELWEVKNRRQQRRERLGDLVEQTAREDVGQIGNLYPLLVFGIFRERRPHSYP